MSDRARRAASIGLLIAGVVALVLGTTGLFARERIFDPNQFADSAVKTLDDEDVRSVASQETTSELIKAEPDLVTAKPLIEVAVASVIQSAPFKAALHRAAEAANRSVFKGEDDALVTVANIGVLASQAVATYKPELAQKVPPGFDATLVRIGEGDVATDGVQIAEKVSFLGLVLPPLGLLFLIGSVFAEVDRRRAVIRAGAGVAIGALVMLVALAVAREVIGAGVDGETDGAAFDAIWDVFLGPLRTWFLILGGFAVVVASAASSALRGHDLGAPLRIGWEKVSSEPEGTRGKAIWALAILAAGLVMILSPWLVLQVLVIVAGAYLVSLGTSTLISLISEPVTREQSRAERRRVLRFVLAGVAVATLTGAVLIAALVADDETTSLDTPSLGAGCNGSEQLCDRNLADVSFAATHNSYAGANYPGYLFPEQDNTIPEQLEAGIRGLWIDTYYGIPGRRVYTDTSKLDPALIAQIDQSLGPKFSAAGSRIRSQIAKPPASAKPEIYLCHGFCELGAVSAKETFEAIASFMKENPDEVLIIDLEDYTTPVDTQALIESTGLADYIYKGPQGPPWPTLRQMIDSGGRILLVSEHMAGGADWYRPINSTIQETPFDFKSIADMTCKEGRGERDTTLFLINNWISTDPTPFPSNAQKVNAYDFLLNRAQKCQSERGLFPNVLNVDFYKQGDVFGVVKTLNGLDDGG